MKKRYMTIQFNQAINVQDMLAILCINMAIVRVLNTSIMLAGL